jgi:hypothetical protein
MSEAAEEPSLELKPPKPRASLMRQDWLVVGWVLAVKMLLFIFGAESYHVLEDKPLPPSHGWLEIWNRWDALHYQQIAQSGYAATGVSKAFYPLYPWSVRALASITRSHFIAALVVSGLASVIAAVLLRRLVQLDYPARVALRSVWFFLIFPTAYFLHVGYSEALFLALALGCFLAARLERWWLAGVLGALCWTTRAPGALLVPTLTVEAAHQYWVRRRWNWQWLCIGFVPLGFAVYLFINWRLSGDAFAFVQTRRTSFVQLFAPPWVGIRQAVGNLHRHPNQAEMVGAQELFFAALGFVCAVASWIKLRPLYAMWMTGSWLLFTGVTFLQSVPRYTLTMFPIFMLFGLLAKNRLWNAAITVWSLLFLALFASLFVRGWWAF